MLVNIKESQQQPGYIAYRKFARAIWGTHGYANPLYGTLQTVPKLSRAAVQQFYHRYYVAKNAMIMIVGNVNLAQAHTIATQLVAQLPQREMAPSIATVDTSHGMRSHIDFPTSQNTILLGEVGVKRDNPDYFPLLVGNHILGDPGLSSILMRNVRAKYGLTYDIYSSLLPLTQRGAFVISLKSRNQQAKRATQITRQILNSYFAEGPTATQLKAAKNDLITSFPLMISSNSKLLGNLIDIGYYHLPLDFLDTYRENINAVTTKQIKRAFNHYLKIDQLVIVSVGGTQ